MGVEEVKKVLFSVAILSMLVFSAFGFTSNATRTSIFDSCQPETMRRLTAEELEKDWFTLKVSKGEGMFNPVFLPFDYLCEDGEGDPNQSLTFPALLSFKFDFAPDNFSARHPGFIFRRDTGALRLKSTDHQGIAAYIKAWTATHAVAGELIETKTGYKGALMVFDDEGEKIFQKKYETPVPYFILMGRMVQDWLFFREVEFSPGLAQELVRPMTTEMETVKWYGETFDVEWRSQDEWDIYERILERDPLFGEVQFWYANQRGWETGDGKWTQVGKGKALLGHIVIPAIWEFYPRECPDESLIANYKKVIDYAGEIMPEDPRIVNGLLDIEGASFTIEQLISLTDLAARYPRYHPLLSKLAQKFEERAIHDRSIPLYLSATNSGFLEGQGKYDHALGRLGIQLWRLGFLEESIAFQAFGLQDYTDDNKPWRLYYLGNGLREAFRYEDAASLYLLRYIKHADSWSLLFGYMSLFEGGLLSILEEWETSPVTAPISEIRPYYLARKAIAQGDLAGAFAALQEIELGDEEIDLWLRGEAEIIRADALLLAGKEKEAAEHAWNAWYLNPRSRRSSYLVEKAAEKDLLHLTRFAKTASFIFPEQEYWRRMLSRLTQTKKINEKSRDLTGEFKRLKEAEEKTPTEEKAQFWFSVFPYTPEYLCLQLVQGSEKSLREDALRFYLKYTVTMRDLSEFQAAHVRVFFLQLVGLLPSAEREGWIKELDGAWEGFFLE